MKRTIEWTTTLHVDVDMELLAENYRERLNAYNSFFPDAETNKEWAIEWAVEYTLFVREFEHSSLPDEIFELAKQMLREYIKGTMVV